jgi:hypothetical protein
MPTWLFFGFAMAPWWSTYGGRHLEEAFGPELWAAYLLVALTGVPAWVHMPAGRGSDPVTCAPGEQVFHCD